MPWTGRRVTHCATIDRMSPDQSFGQLSVVSCQLSVVSCQLSLAGETTNKPRLEAQGMQGQGNLSNFTIIAHSTFNLLNQ
jgi:hypothetical protein